MRKASVTNALKIKDETNVDSDENPDVAMIDLIATAKVLQSPSESVADKIKLRAPEKDQVEK